MKKPVSSGCCGRGSASLQRTPVSTTGEIYLPRTEKSLSVTTLNFVSGSCLDFFHGSVGGVSIIVTVQRFTLSMEIRSAGKPRTAELPLQLTHQSWLPRLPKFVHRLACSEWHVMVKKLTVLDFLSWNSITFFNVSWAELYLEMFQPH